MSQIDQSASGEAASQTLIQLARQYEPDNDALVEAGSTAETGASIPVALEVLRKAHVEDPRLQFVAMWCRCGEAVTGYVGVLRCSSCGRLYSVSRMEIGQT